MPKVDFAHYQGREQAYIKHCLLEKYLPEWAWKVGSQWDSLVYIDGFAGPWDVRSPDMADSSFGIATNALSRVASDLNNSRGKRISVECVLVERDPDVFPKLQDYATSNSRPGFSVHALEGDFHDRLPEVRRITENAGNAFKFVFLDPKGWSLDMQKILPLISGRSCEVVVNLMTRHITRFVEEDDRKKSIESLIGRNEAVEVVRSLPKGERTDALVREYCKSLHHLANFRYVSSAAIFDPEKDEIRYFLIYGTNHHRGIEVFKAAESVASRLQDTIRHDASVRKAGGQEDMLSSLFGEGVPTTKLAFREWKKYCCKARQKVVDRLLQNPTGVPFAELFCDAMAFPLVNPDDLHGWLVGWRNEGAIEFKLERTNCKKPSLDRNDFIVVTSPELLGGIGEV